MAPNSQSSDQGSPAGLSAQGHRPGGSPQWLVADPRHNRLLASLPEADWQRWRAHLQPVAMLLGQALYESGEILSHGYFPTTAIVSLMYVTQSGASSEIAVVGNDGIVGVPLFMGGGSTPSRAVVKSAGVGFRMPARAIRERWGQVLTFANAKVKT